MNKHNIPITEAKNCFFYDLCAYYEFDAKFWKTCVKT